MESVLDGDGPVAGPSNLDNIYTQARPMRKPMFYGANLSGASGSTARVAFPRQSQNTLHVNPTSVSLVSMQSATSSGEKRRTNKLRKLPPDSPLRGAKRGRRSAGNLTAVSRGNRASVGREDTEMWRASYVVDEPALEGVLPPAARAVRRAGMEGVMGGHPLRQERPLSDTALDYRAYDVATYEFPPRRRAEPEGDIRSRRQSVVTFEDSPQTMPQTGVDGHVVAGSGTPLSLIRVIARSLTATAILCLPC